MTTEIKPVCVWELRWRGPHHMQYLLATDCGRLKVLSLSHYISARSIAPTCRFCGLPVDYREVTE
jgi:hypothetical protein